MSKLRELLNSAELQPFKELRKVPDNLDSLEFEQVLDVADTALGRVNRLPLQLADQEARAVGDVQKRRFRQSAERLVRMLYDIENRI